jgi:hypothetical protein
MNYSVNYAGFIDLASQAPTIESLGNEAQETQNCKPAPAIALSQGDDPDTVIEVTLAKPIQASRGCQSI